MNRPVLTRRHLVASGAAALGAVALPVSIVEALAAEPPCTGAVAPTTFDPVAFLADLKTARCRVYLAMPATVFRSEDDRPTYFIAPSRSYTAVMAKWHDAMEACPDHVEQVVAHLSVLNGEVS